MRFATLAPSSHNTQPWQFSVGWDHVELFADRARQLRVSDPDGRELVISCGAALMNFRVACHRFGRESAITLLPDPEEPDLLAWAGCGASISASTEDVRLFEALPHRRTTRVPFKRRNVPDALLRRLMTAAEREGARLVPLQGEAARKQLAEVVDGATREQFQNRRFRAELAAWMRGSARLDGIPPQSLGLGPLRGRLAPWVVRTFDLGGAQASRDRAVAHSAPLVVVLATDRDTRAHWLRAGQALERILLAAADEGVSASYLNTPVQLPAWRSELAAIAVEEGAPQIVVGFGYAPHKPWPTPRRPLAHVTRPLA